MAEAVTVDEELEVSGWIGMETTMPEMVFGGWRVAERRHGLGHEHRLGGQEGNTEPDIGT